MTLTFCQSHRLTFNSAANSYVDIEAVSLRKKHVFFKTFLAKTMLVIVFNRMLLQQVSQYINHLVH